LYQRGYLNVDRHLFSIGVRQIDGWMFVFDHGRTDSTIVGDAKSIGEIRATPAWIG
jgi:hypothetical protein